MTITIIDGTYKLLPLEFAIIKIKNGDSYELFQFELRRYIRAFESLALINDHNPSILSIIKDILFEAHHGYFMIYL